MLDWMDCLPAYKLFVCVMIAWFGVMTTPYTRKRFQFGLVGAFVVFLCAGCAALPMPLQPKDSAPAEGAWLVLDGVDTVQTMHLQRVRSVPAGANPNCAREMDPIARKIYGSDIPPPGRVLAVNLALMTVHTMITAWFDDEVAAHADSRGWYYTRATWLTASLAYSGYSVIHNINQGCRL